MAENFFGITDTGKLRTNNEDTFVAQPTTDGRFILACVIDGVGGYEGGEVAAAIAHDAVIEQVNAGLSQIENAIVAALQAANERIFNARQQDKKHDSMACVCTLVVADLEKKQFSYGHVGDTRLYLLRDGSLIKISSDHSFVGFLEDSGRLTEEAAMSHPKRNEINKALGFEPSIANQPNYIETGTSPFLPGDLLLLCSDGLTDMVGKHDITAILNDSSSLKEKGKHLIDLANHNGGQDNITAVLVKNDRQSVMHDAIKPVAGQKKRSEQEEPVTLPAEKPVAEMPALSMPPAKKHSRSSTIALIVIAIAILGAAAFWFTGQQQKSQASAVAVTDTPRTDTTAVQQPLTQALDSLKSDTLDLKLAALKMPLNIAQSISIKQDTLFVKGDSTTIFKAENGFTGPALELPPHCKLIVLSNITFDGFKTAIKAYNSALVLKKVKFINCETPVLIAFTPTANMPVTGWLPDHIYKTDTVKAMKK